MKWLPPRIERCRSFNKCCSVFLLAIAGLSSGCTSMPVMHSASVGNGPSLTVANAVLAEVGPPDFDIVPKTLIASTSPPSRSGTIAAPQPIAPQDLPGAKPAFERAGVSGSEPQKVVTSGPSPNESPKPASSGPLVQQPAYPESNSYSAAKPPASSTNSANSASPRVATQRPAGVLVAPPKPLSWQTNGTSTGGRTFQTVSPGDDGYRTLVVGSVGGNDPVALELVEQLAKRLHEDSLILGGFDCTIIRTLNPDGEANRNFLNEKGQYINGYFPKPPAKADGSEPAEVKYLLAQLQQLQPQRVVHIRTIRGSDGLIAASESCQSAAKEATQWLKFRLLSLPQDSQSEGSLERYISLVGSSEIITFAFPETTPREELWERYGDTLLNLLLGDDAATRETARRQSQNSSADRRNQSPGK